MRTKSIFRLMQGFLGRATPYLNVWLGVSVCMMKTAYRAGKLRHVSPFVRFISAEPLLESLENLNLQGIHWLIACGESWTNCTPMELRWAERLKKKCKASGKMFFFKEVSGPRSDESEKALGKVYHDWRGLRYYKSARN